MQKADIRGPYHDRVSKVREKLREIPVWSKVMEKSGNCEIGQGISQIHGKSEKRQGTLYMSLRVMKIWVERLGRIKSMFQDIEVKGVDTSWL